MRMAGTGTWGIGGKVVLLTGAAGGIGAAAAPLLAKAGAFCPGSTASQMTRAMIDAGGTPGGEAAHGTELFLDRVFPHLLDRLWNTRCDDTYYALLARGGRAGRPD